MASNQQHFETLGEIRDLMNRSSRFVSLSGLSGVCAGVFALAGAAAAYLYLGGDLFFGLKLFGSNSRADYHTIRIAERMREMDFYSFMLLDAAAVLICALISGTYFTWRRAKRAGAKLWDETSRRLIVQLLVPLSAGGLFCFFLLLHEQAALLAPAALVFYGMALFSAAKYTFKDVQYLGICQIGLGLAGLLFPAYGLMLWALGFGVLHIVYGLVMYYRYERKPNNV
ncbi:MAG: hypothetical protein ACRC3B_16200 [Bacteroidia bacterium]